MHAPVVQGITSDATSYRPDIDGLRAVAVLSVLAFHYGAPLPGGFTGVDVFFVISGFLITSRLMDDIAAGRFSILGFYDRRIRRILPALVVMLAATLFAGKFLLMPGDYRSLANSTAASAFGVSNFYFLANTGYFDQAANLMPLLHTWSLAVEEQFYVFWPVLLFVITRKHATAAISAIVIVGFVASLIWFDVDPKSAFYSVLPRAWELAIGAVLVFLPPLRFSAPCFVGLLMIIAGFVLIDDLAFPGVAAFVPCAGAALVIWPQAPSKTARWLGYLSPVGLISYSLYLWHWPVWVLFRIYINNGAPSFGEALALSAVSVALATASYIFVEQPFRKRRWPPARSIQAGLAACTALFCAAMYVESAEGLPERIPPANHAMRSLNAMWEWDGCETVNTGIPGATCTIGAKWSDGAEKALLWGDSNAMHIAPLLQNIATSSRVSVALSPACLPLLDEKTLYDEATRPGYNKTCQPQNEQTLDVLSHRPDIKTVILSASWVVSLQNLKGAGTPALLFERSLTNLARELTGKNIVIVATVPQWLNYSVDCALLDVGLLRRPCGDADRYLTKAYYQQNQRESLRIFRSVAAHFPNVRLIIPGDSLCAGEHCITQLNSEPIYRDVAHLRRNLSERTNRDLAKLIGLDRIF